MPLLSGKSDRVVSANIATEMAAGRPQKQAIAIAMRKAGRARPRTMKPGTAPRMEKPAG